MTSPWSKREMVFAAGGAALLGAAFLVARKGRLLRAGDYIFPYHDAEWLYAEKGERFGGMAYVSPETREGARLLIYLHGNNEGGMAHGGLGAADTDYDLRTLVPPGTVVAAPSQTKNATDAMLWRGFSLDEFVTGVERAIGAKVDRSNVILMGHSGAGCSPIGGLLAPLGQVRPRLVAVVDTCGGPGYGDAFGKLGETVPVRVFYQTATWANRDFAGFANALRGRASFEHVVTPPGQNPHSAIVSAAVREVLR